jgi:hypothetical protein
MCYFCDETGGDTTCEIAKKLFVLGKAYLDHKHAKEEDLVKYATGTLHAECIILLDAFVHLHFNEYVKEKQRRYRDNLWVFWNGRETEIGMNHEFTDGFGILFQKDGSWSVHS